MESAEESYKPQGMLENSSNEGLSRQVTLQLSQEQYDRLFFAPNVPRGDLSRRLGNPTLFGLMGFCSSTLLHAHTEPRLTIVVIPFSSTIFILCSFQNSDPPVSLIGLDGDYFMIGEYLEGEARILPPHAFPGGSAQVLTLAARWYCYDSRRYLRFYPR